MAAGDIIGAVSWHFLVKRSTIVMNCLGERLSVKKQQQKNNNNNMCFFAFIEYEQGTVSPPGPNCPWSLRRFRIRTNYVCVNVSKYADGFPSLFHFAPFLFFIFSGCGVVTTRARQLARFFSSTVCVASTVTVLVLLVSSVMLRV